MNENQLLQQLGRSGWTIVSRTPVMQTVTDPDTKETTQQPTGYMQWIISDGKGHNQTMIVQPPDTGRGGDYTLIKAPEDLPANANPQDQASLNAQRDAAAQQTQEQTAQLQAERAQREKNQANGLGYLTDAEVSKLQSDAASQGLTQQQIDNQRQNYETQARQADAQLAQRQKEFDVTAGQSDARLAIDAANSEIARINADTAAKRSDIEAQVAQGNLSLDQAKLEYQKVKDQADNDIQQQQLRIQSAQQAATEQYQQGQLGIQRGQLGVSQGQLANQTLQTQEAQRSDLAREALTGRQLQLQEQQQAEQARANQAAESYRNLDLSRQAAGDVLTSAQQGAQTGAALLNQRAGQAASMYQGTMGQLLNARNLGLGSVPDISGLPGAIGDWLTGLGGGQQTYDTAANLVRAADPNNSSGFAASAAAMLSQIADRARSLSGGQPILPTPLPPLQTAGFQAPSAFPSAPPTASTTPVTINIGPGFSSPHYNQGPGFGTPEATSIYY